MQRSTNARPQDDAKAPQLSPSSSESGKDELSLLPSSQSARSQSISRQSASTYEQSESANLTFSAAITSMYFYSSVIFRQSYLKNYQYAALLTFLAARFRKASVIARYLAVHWFSSSSSSDIFASWLTVSPRALWMMSSDRSWAMLGELEAIYYKFWQVYCYKPTSNYPAPQNQNITSPNSTLIGLDGRMFRVFRVKALKDYCFRVELSLINELRVELIDLAQHQLIHYRQQTSVLY